MELNQEGQREPTQVMGGKVCLFFPPTEGASFLWPDIGEVDVKGSEMFWSVVEGNAEKQKRNFCLTGQTSKEELFISNTLKQAPSSVLYSNSLN